MIHFDFQYLELVGEELSEADLHEILEDAIGGLLVEGFEVEVAGDVVHAYTK